MPSYNVANTIAATIKRIPAEALRLKGYSLSLYVVDDGSSDGTSSEIKKLEPLNFPLTVLNHATNRGYGAAQKTGLSASLSDGNDLHVILHGDGQYAPEELDILLSVLKKGEADLVIGSKFKKGRVLRQGMPLIRMIGIRLMDGIENLVYGTRGLEFHSGYMAYSSPVLEGLRFDEKTDGFHFDGEIVAAGARKGYSVALVPISTSYGNGTSSLSPAPYLLEVLSSMFHNRKAL